MNRKATCRNIIVRLGNLRKIKRISQREVATLCDIDPRNLSKLERVIEIPKADKFIKYIYALIDVGITYDEIVEIFKIEKRGYDESKQKNSIQDNAGDRGT